LIATCHAHGKPAGVLAGSVEATEAWRTRGFRVFAYGTDISLLQQSLRDGLVRLRTGEGR
jgi:2-keto-3-deoxy-L-rhamnonate aldolase RhmA